MLYSAVGVILLGSFGMAAVTESEGQSHRFIRV